MKRCRLKKGQRVVQLMNIKPQPSPDHVWCLVPRMSSEPSGRPHVQIVALRNLEMIDETKLS